MSIEAMKQALEGVTSMARCGQLDKFIGEPWLNAVFAAIEQAEKQERNFCERCGKRLGGAEHIHTCTPPTKE